MASASRVQLPLVLLAYQAPHTNTLLKTLLEHEGFTVLAAFNGRAAIQLVRQHHPALVLLGRHLPVVDGVDVCRGIRAEGNDTPIFILTDQHDELDTLLSFSAGADECLALPMHPREFLARVHVVLRRHPDRATTEQILRSGPIELDRGQHRTLVDGTVVTLTALEFDLLKLFLERPGYVFSREELLKHLHEHVRGDPFDRAIDIHICNLRNKLRGSADAARAIETVRGTGYRFRASPAESPPSHHADSRTGGAALALEALRRAPMPMLVLGPDRTVILYNEAAEQLCGWHASEVTQQVKCFSLLLCHHSNGTLMCHDSCVLHGSQLSDLSDQSAVYTITSKDGRDIPVSAHYSRLEPVAPDGAYTLLTLQPIDQAAPF